ncbi:MAG: DEAD/DEAH box helicase [Porphyromonadaceae bacterium]|nr:MAG: DEAD/DEAH box helicase [Porphyromonadaceae bacterium]
MTIYHAIYYAYELSRRHSLNDSEKLATALADAMVDLNPHQLDAALFAFQSPLSKGSILADEVGLGKTIEAGLVIAQKWSEQKKKILIITPANLRKQWSMEMEEKFYLPTLILESKNYKQFRKDGIKNPFVQSAIVICSYQFAARNNEAIMTRDWNLAIIDEAHRLRNVYKPDNKIAKAIKTALMNTPKILLTATPLQNSLMELYGLVSVIDDYTFGDDRSFKTQYARLTSEDSFDELKARLAPLCHRTLRRQVLEYIRFTNRIPLTEDFYPTADEYTLYDMVTEYLQREVLYALPNSQRQLITLILRKLLASSTFAIAGALETLANRLRQQIKGASKTNDIEEIQKDYEEFDTDAEEWDEDADDNKLTLLDIQGIEAEIKELEAFHSIAVSITENAKGQALLSALSQGFRKAIDLGGAEKALIFTESRKTQNYLIRLLSENGYQDQIVLFNGTNNDNFSKVIYAEWVDRYRNTDRVTGSKSADIRAALVDYFKNTAKIMIATEAGAEGINLQFCSIVVNYDLPWNPQRIEQRIGRCHRYGQKHDVVVINFINRKNAADLRVYELLDQKFKLFSGVFGASDEVLGAIESGVEFEKRIAAIYQNCRTTAEIESEFERLQQEMEANITATMTDTRKKLLENFDADVHDRLRVNLTESREYLNKFDTMLWKLTCFGLDGKASFDQTNLRFTLNDISGLGSKISKGTYALTREVQNFHRYRIGHPLAQSLIANVKSKNPDGALIQFDYTAWSKKSENLRPLVGQSGTLTLFHLGIDGSDEQDHLLPIAITDREEILSEEIARRFFDLPATVITAKKVTLPKKLQAETQMREQSIIKNLEARQAVWFDEEIEKLNYWADDKRKGLKTELKEFDDEIALLKKEARVAPNLPDKLAIQKKLRDIDKKRDTSWREYDEAAKNIEKQKDELLDSVEERLKQTIHEKSVFNIRWTIV